MKLSLIPGLLACLVFVGGARAATGVAVPELASYDTEMQALMSRWGVPGASVAVVRNGRLVFARGYGVADSATGAPVQPHSLFRIASISKPITSAAIMKLVEDGALTLDLPVFPYLARGTPLDARLNQITVRHLLEHSGGWDRDIAGDPLFKPITISRAMGVPSPPDAGTILRWMLTQPLEFSPGTRYAYSNFGYLVLGEVIAKASGQSYENYARTLLLKAGITRMRLGASLRPGRLADEVEYTMPPGSALVASVFASAPGLVPYPYGGFALEPHAANGGWVASAIDLAAFAAAMDRNTVRPDLLGSASLAEVSRRPGYAAASATSWYGKGWYVNSSGNWWHSGTLRGTSTLLVNAANGTQWAVLLNLRAEPENDDLHADLDDTMWRAYRAVSAWPAGDQFAALQSAGPISGCLGTPSFAAGVLCLPAVEVPNGTARPDRYTATLRLTDAATLTFSFIAVSPVVNSDSSIPTFDPATGVVSIPRVLLLYDPGGIPRAYNVRLQLVQGPGGPSLRVTAVTPL